MTEADVRRRLRNGEVFKYYKPASDRKTVIRKTRHEAEIYERAQSLKAKKVK